MQPRLPFNTNTPSFRSQVPGSQACPPCLHNTILSTSDVNSEISWQSEFAFLFSSVNRGISIYLSAVCISFGGSCLQILCPFPSMVSGVFLVRRHLIGLKDFSLQSMIKVVSIFLCCPLPHLMLTEAPHSSLSIFVSSYLPPCLILWTLTSVIWFMAQNFLAR